MRRGVSFALVAFALAIAIHDAAAQDGIHVVLPGETLWQIAAAITGDAYRWPELYRANRDQIKDPALLYPGQRLSIPDFGPAGSAARGSESGSPGGDPDH